MKPTQNFGFAAEDWLAAELIAQHWQIIAQRWHCPRGELDLVILGGDVLAFVEVKARQSRGLDQHGLLSVTPAKQRKLRLTAELFLDCHPELIYTDCRFDVALIGLHQDVFVLQNYLAGAFE